MILPVVYLPVHVIPFSLIIFLFIFIAESMKIFSCYFRTQNKETNKDSFNRDVDPPSMASIYGTLKWSRDLQPSRHG